VANALRTDGESFPDSLGAGSFAGVVGQVKTGLRGLGIKGAKGRGAGAALVASQANADDGGMSWLEFGSLAEDALGLLDGKVAHGIKDPVDREAQFAFGALAGSLQGGEDWLEGGGVVVAPVVDDADGDVNLGVNHSLSGKMLHHAPGGQLVVFRADQLRGDGLEGVQEAGKVREAVERFGLDERERADVVASAQVNQSRGQNRALEVQMQLGLGQAADKVLDSGHGFQ